MSRSYRKPFTTFVVCGNHTPHRSDKAIASRAARRTMNRYLRRMEDYESFLMPHRHDCPHNDVWGWDRDGNPHYVSPFYYELPETFVEIDVVTQVERVLDGKPAIWPRRVRFWSKEQQLEYHREVQRK